MDKQPTTSGRGAAESRARQNARRLGIPLRTSGFKVNRNRTAQELREHCLESLYGGGWRESPGRGTQAVDARIEAGIRASLGEFGRAVQEAQCALRIGRDALTEYHRIRKLKQRRSAEEATLLSTVKAKFAEAEAAMNRHAMRAAIRDGAVTVLGDMTPAQGGGREIRDDAGQVRVSWGG